MPRPPALTLLYDDADLVAIAKPAGVPSIPAAGAGPSAIKLLAEQLGLPFKGDVDPRVRPVHRLDQDTSGVLLFVKNRPAQQFVSNQFQNNQVRKQYVALVHGKVTEDSGSIDARLERDPRDPIRMRVQKHGKRALTDWTVAQRFRDFTLLNVFPRTGKTHQIRVHLAHIGHPLAVDPLYGPRAPRTDPDIQPPPPGVYLSTIKRDYRRGKHDEEAERPLIGRLTLHAEALALNHPTGQPLELKCEMPKDLRATLNMLTKYGSR